MRAQATRVTAPRTSVTDRRTTTTEYAEHADFFYVWLKRTTGTSTLNGLRRSSRQGRRGRRQPCPLATWAHKAQKAPQYERKMEAAFREMARVLRPRHPHRDVPPQEGGGWGHAAMALSAPGSPSPPRGPSTPRASLAPPGEEERRAEHDHVVCRKQQRSKDRGAMSRGAEEQGRRILSSPPLLRPSLRSGGTIYRRGCALSRGRGGGSSTRRGSGASASIGSWAGADGDHRAVARAPPEWTCGRPAQGFAPGDGARPGA